MPEPEPRVIFDGDIEPAVRRLIGEAKEYVVLVTPYFSFRESLRDEIQHAAQRDVRVSAIFRRKRWTQDQREDARWLCGEGAMVYAVPNLHAKLYLNESSVLLTSMNLNEANSREVGIRVKAEDDTRAFEELRQYTLQLEKEGTLFKPRRVMMQGRCIRCNASIPYRFAHPLCDEHFVEWARSKKSVYTAWYCHGCGNERGTTYAKPLCFPCWQEQGRPHSLFG